MRQEYTQAIKTMLEDFLRDVHTAFPGKIVSFDPDRCEATVSPTAKYRRPDDKQIDFPDIFHVPIFFMQGIGQTATIVHPVRKDDECLIFIPEQALDLWRTGAESPTDLRFDITNAIALVGFFSQPNPLVRRAHDNESIIIQRENSYVELFDKRIEIDTDGDIGITAAKTMRIHSVGDMVISSDTHIAIDAPRVDINLGR